MKKSLLALAVLGVFAGAASAQSSVTLSGSIDAGIKRVGTATGSDWSLGGSQSGYNAFTISGREDLGGGMSAFFAMNHRFAVNSGAVNSQTGVFWRNIWVGLAGGFGDVRLGRILMPLQDMNGGFDPFLTGTVGTTHTGGMAATIRAHSAIYYRSPSIGGLKVEAAIAAGEGQLQGETANNFGQQGPTAFPTATSERPTGFNVRYAAGPLNVGAAWDKNAADLKTTGFYGSYDFGAFKLLAQYEDGDDFRGGTVKEESKNLSVGVTAPFGPVLVRAGFVRVNSNLNTCANGGAGTKGCDGSKFGIGGDYNLSKRTNLYSTIGKTTGERFTPAQKKAAFDIGVTHRF